VSARRAGLGLLLAAAACDGDPKPSPPGPASAATPSAVALASAAPSASVPTRHPKIAPATRPGCRVIALSGEVKEDDTVLANGTVIYGTRWLRLAKGASLTLRHTVSSREVSLEGPGLALPCLEGEEDALLAEGTFQSTAGPGARPGAEVVVFTPTGTVSYGDAQISLRASKAKSEVTTSKGEAWVLPSKDATRKGPEKLGGPKDKTTLTAKGGVEPLVAECERSAGEAEGLARAVLTPTAGDGGTLGDRAAAHLKARKVARGACGSARAAAATEPDAAKRAGLEKRVEEAGKRWRSLGTPGPKSSGD